MSKVRLTEICDFQGGSQPPKSEWKNEYADGYIRMLQIRDFTQTRTTNPEYIKLTDTVKTCKSDDILIARYGASIGKILFGLEGAYNVAIMKTIPNESRIMKPYLKHFLISDCFQNYILSVGSRAAQAGFNKDELSQIEIPLPPLETQKQIAANLDKVTHTINLCNEILEKLDFLVKSRFVEMFEDIENKYTLAEICSIITDGTHQPPKFVLKGIPFLFVSNISTNEITYNSEKFISEETYYELYKRTPIQKGDIILSTVGSYGHPAVVKSDKRFLFQRHIAYLKPRTNVVNSIYLHSAILSNDVQEQIEDRVKGIAQKTLNLSEIKKITIPIPPMELQTQFADFVEQTDKSKLAVKQVLEKAETLKKALMQEYFG